MNSFRHFFRTTILGGIFFLFPLIIAIILLSKAGDIVHKMTQPISTMIPVDSVAGVGIELLVTIAVLILVCFVAGLISRTPWARKLISHLEHSLLSNIPGYEFLKGLGENAVQIHEGEGTQPVLVKFEEGWQFAFLVESLDDGLAVIFIPDAPNPMGGAVMVVKESILTPLPTGSRDMLKVLKGLGYGSNDLISASSSNERSS